jgi:uncharacterized small protein (DUF1192 family)
MRDGVVVMVNSWLATKRSARFKGALVGPRGCDNLPGRSYFSAQRGGLLMEEEDRPKKRLVHEIGQDLALLSVEELRERIALLKDEIARLEALVASKRASRSAAYQFFKS